MIPTFTLKITHFYNDGLFYIGDEQLPSYIRGLYLSCYNVWINISY